MSDLVLRPKKFIKDEVGYKNQYKIEIATEIFLAKVSLLPDFFNFQEDSKNEENIRLKKWLDTEIDLFKRKYPKKYFENDLRTIYFFDFIADIYQNYLINNKINDLQFNERVVPYVSYRFLKDKFKNNKLISHSARTMFKRDQYYKNSNKQSYDLYKKILNQTNSSENTIEEVTEKIEGIMILQHRELYEIQQELFNKTTEFVYFDLFHNDFEIALQKISNKIIFV